MGSVNNGKMLKPGGAKALAAEFVKNQPKDQVGVWGCVTIDGRKIFSKKKTKVAGPVTVGSKT
jgi:hypothetical protein